MTSSPRVVAPPPSGSAFDLIVIGGGTIGLSAAYYASARGLKTLLLEQFGQIADPHASSGGYSRMFRVMYSPSYMAQLAEVSLALWQEIETASRRTILARQPLIFYGASENTVEGNLGEMKTILADLGAPYEWYPTAAGLFQRYPVFNTMPPDYVGLVQPNSAAIRTRESIAAFIELAGDAGASLVTGQAAQVTAIPTEGPYQVTCLAGTYSAPRLVLCPSAWTNQVLLPFGIQLNLSIWQMTVAYFSAAASEYAYPLWYEFGPPPDHAPASQQSFPHTLAPGTTAASTSPQNLFYGFPPDEAPQMIKVSADFTNNIYSDPSQCTYQPDPEILSLIGSFLQHRFNGVQAAPNEAVTCLYTMSSDYQMILDRVPGHPNVAIFSGNSGRGFKFTPLFGRILADLVATGQTYYDISPFSIARPGVIAG